MSLYGDAAITVWNDVREDMEDEFREWHTRQHALERVGIPGFMRARRYRSVAGDPRYFMLYELDSLNAAGSCDYMARLSHPTQWTLRMSCAFSNSLRSLGRVSFSQGVGQGGVICTFAYDVKADDEAEHQRLVAHSLLPSLCDKEGIVGVHLCRTDVEMSAVRTEEKKTRSIGCPGWVVLVEGSVPAEKLRLACAGLKHSLEKSAGVQGMRAEVFALEFSRGKMNWN
jgi:hypothetical protein